MPRLYSTRHAKGTIAEIVVFVWTDDAVYCPDSTVGVWGWSQLMEDMVPTRLFLLFDSGRVRDSELGLGNGQGLGFPF